MLYAMKAFHGFRRNYFSGRKRSVHIDFQSTEELAITSIVWSASGVSESSYLWSTLMTYHVVSNTVLLCSVLRFYNISVNQWWINLLEIANCNVYLLCSLSQTAILKQNVLFLTFATYKHKLLNVITIWHMVGWLVISVNNRRTFQALALKLLVNHIKINIIFIIILIQVEVDLLKINK